MSPMWTLLGVVVLVVGFATRRHPLVVVLVAACATGLLAGFDPVRVLASIGKAWNANRYMAVGWLVLPVVGVLERAGLRERAQRLVGRARGLTAGRLLLLYLVLRQAGAALGLTSLGGHASMVRPLVAPMTEASAERVHGPLSAATRALLRAHAAAVDNIGLFFGEDIFVAIGSILLMKGVLAQNGYEVDPLRLALYAIPTAIFALVFHGARLLRLDRRLARSGTPPKLGARPSSTRSAEAGEEP